MIRYGDLLFSGPMSELVSRAGGCIEAQPEHVADVARLGRLSFRPGVGRFLCVRKMCSSTLPASQAADVNRAAAEAGMTLSALRPRNASLEDVFLRMTGEPREASA